MKHIAAIPLLLLMAVSAVGAEQYRFIFVGDSITQNNTNFVSAANLSIPAFPWFSMHSITATNIARGGASLDDLYDYFYTGYTPGQDDHEKSDFAVLWQLADPPTTNVVYVAIGANDWSHTTSWIPYITDANGETWFRSLTNYLDMIRSNATFLGKTVKIVGCTILPGNGTCFDYNTNGLADPSIVCPGWQNANNRIRGTSPSLLDLLADNALVLPDTYAKDAAGTSLYADGVIHPSDTGEFLITSNLDYILGKSSTFTTTYYVDVNATGVNNGTNWANAWTSLTNVDYLLNLVPANSVVEIAAGDYLTTNELQNLPAYDSFRLCGGTAWTNCVVYRATLDPAHTGTVRIHHALALGPYVQLIGEKTAGYEALMTNNTYRVYWVTNNCNLVIDLRDVEYRDAGWHSFLTMVGGGPSIVRWVKGIGLEVPTFGTRINWSAMEANAKAVSSPDIYAVHQSGASKVDLGYCWFDQFDQGFNLTGADVGAQLGDVYVHHTLMQNHHTGIFDEGFGPGIDFSYNIFEKRHGDYRHSEADGFQCNGGGLHDSRIHHNIIEPPDNSVGDWVVSSNSYNLFFYANVIKPESFGNIPIYLVEQFLNSPLMIRADTDGVTFSNVAFFNNTLIAGPTPPAQTTALLQFQNDAFTKTVAANGVLVENNLFIHGGAGEYVSFGFSNWVYDASAVIFDYNLSYTADPTHAIARWITNVAGPSSLLLTNAAQISSELGFTHNVSETAVTLHNEAALDYRPNSSAVNIGTNLIVNYSSVINATNTPNFNLDIYGVTRSASAAWSVGAVEYQAITDTAAPVIVENLVNRNSPLGSTPVFALLASGAPPLKFFWYFNGSYRTNGDWPFYQLLPHSTNSDIGSYSVVVSNQYGTATSRTATYTADITNGLVVWLQFDESSRWTNGGYIPDHSGRTNHAYVFDPPEFSTALAGHYTSDIAYSNSPDSNGHYYLDPFSASLNAHRAPIPTNGPNELNAAQFTVVYRGPDPPGYNPADPHSYGTFAGITNQDPLLLNMTNGTWSVWAQAQMSGGWLWAPHMAFASSGYELNNWAFRQPPQETVPGFIVHTNGTESPFFRAAEFADISTVSGWKHYAVTWDGANWISYSNAVPILTNTSTFACITITNSLGGATPAYNWLAIGHQTHSGLPNQVMATGFPNNGALVGKMSDLRIYNRALTPGEIELVYAFEGSETPAASTNSFRASGRITASGRVTMR